MFSLAFLYSTTIPWGELIYHKEPYQKVYFVTTL